MYKPKFQHMLQTELHKLIARNKLLSKEQKYVLFEKIKTASEEQLQALVTVFQKSNEKYKPVLINKLKQTHARAKQFNQITLQAKKKILKVSADTVSQVDAQNAEVLLDQELKNLEPRPKEKKSFFKKTWEFIHNLFS